MKKTITNMLGLSKNIINPFRNTIHFYSDNGNIIAHSTNFAIDVKFNCGVTSAAFNIVVSSAEVRKTLKLSSYPEIVYSQQGLAVNGVYLQPVKCLYPEWELEEMREVTKLDKNSIDVITTASKYAAIDDTRPLFQNVYIDSKNIVATNSHILYTKPHTLNIEKPLFIDVNAVPFLTDGTLYANKSKCKLENSNVEIIWHMTDRVYPDYSRVIPTEGEVIDFVNDKALMNSVKLQTVQAELKDKTRKPINFIKDAFFNGDYVQKALKTLPTTFTLKYKSNHAPVLFESADEKIVLIPVKVS
ncbi:MAG: hypothetical protein H6Q67_2356 [Firmicutes bacterium]|nr:hypothetical protein [Bacillota bacterium]